MITEITVREQQSLFDIANQYYGSIVGLQWIIEDNDISLDVPLEFGDKIKIRKGEFVNQRVVNELNSQNIATNG